MMMGVADFPIETLKLLNIHPDSQKGKGKAKQTEEDSTPESGSRAGIEPVSRTPTDMRPATTSNTSLTLAHSSSTLDGRHSTLSQTPTASTPTSPRADTERLGFMAQAMAQSTQVSRSRSPSRDRGLFTPRSNHSRKASQSRAASVSASDIHDKSGSVYTDKSGFSERMFNMNQESIINTGKGVRRIVGAGFKSPLDFSMNVAQGFHNVPKLYGGEVRQVEKVTDFQSGLKTAAKVRVFSTQRYPRADLVSNLALASTMA